MATPLKPGRGTPEGSPSRPSASQFHPPEPESSQLPITDLPSARKECSRCHNVMPLCGFVRSAKDSSTNGFKIEEMKVCNHCAFVQRNARAAGDHKDRVPKSDRMLKQLSREEYMDLYGAKAIIKGTPAGGNKKKERDDDDDDDDEAVEYYPPQP